MIFLEKRLPADDSHEISYLLRYFSKSSKNLNCRLLLIIGGALWVRLELFTYLSIQTCVLGALLNAHSVCFG